MKIYLVHQLRSCPGPVIGRIRTQMWEQEIQGVFSTVEKAIAACQTESDYYLELELDEDQSRKTPCSEFVYFWPHREGFCCGVWTDAEGRDIRPADV